MTAKKKSNAVIMGAREESKADGGWGADYMRRTHHEKDLKKGPAQPPKGPVKKKPKPKPKPKVQLPGYKVPGKLLKNTRANRMASGTGTFADVKAITAAEYKPPKVVTPKPPKVSDWSKGAGYVDSQYGSLASAAEKVRKKAGGGR